MSAPVLHIFDFDNARADHFGVFDENGDAPFDCEASGTGRDTARRLVASWNAMRHLTVEQIEAVANGVAQLEVV